MRNKPTMCILTTICLLIMILIGWSLCAYSYQEDEQSSQSFPRIEFNETTFDFGLMRQKKEVSHNFVFRNIGKMPLIIERVRNSCGCTATVIMEKEIPPGDVGEIKVTFHSGKYLGRQEKSIYVHSNDPQEPIVKLLISGEVTTQMGIKPNYIHFGNVPIKEGGVQKIRLYQLEEQELKVEGVRINRDLFLTRIARFEQEEVKGWEIEVVLKAGISPGLVSEVLSIETNLPVKRYIDVPIITNVIGDIEVKPNVVSFGNIEKGESVTKKMMVRQPNASEFQLVDIKSYPQFIKTTYSFLDEEDGYEIKLTIPHDAPKGRLQGEIDIFTNSTDQPLIHVPVYGRIVHGN